MEPLHPFIIFTGHKNIQVKHIGPYSLPDSSSTIQFILVQRQTHFYDSIQLHLKRQMKNQCFQNPVLYHLLYANENILVPKI